MRKPPTITVEKIVNTTTTTTTRFFNIVNIV